MYGIPSGFFVFILLQEHLRASSSCKMGVCGDVSGVHPQRPCAETSKNATSEKKSDPERSNGAEAGSSTHIKQMVRVWEPSADFRIYLRD